MEKDKSQNQPLMEKVKIRGLFRIAGWILIVWGGWISLLGFLHAFFYEPEANLFSLQKWEFVSQEQWLRWSGFEITYGLACIGIGIIAWEFAKALPDWIQQPENPPKNFLSNLRVFCYDESIEQLT